MLNQSTEQDPLAVLISNANIVDAETLKVAVNDAKRLRVSLDKALVMSGHCSESKLAIVLRARDELALGTMTLNAAISTVRLATKDKISFDEARQRLRTLHRTTQKAVSLTNKLTALMLEAGIINQVQLGQSIQQATTAGMLIGRVLRINRIVSTSLLASCIAAHLMVKEQSQTSKDVVAGLKQAKEKNISVEQALFHLGVYKQPGSYTLRLADLLSMAELLREDDFLECWELAITKDKTFNQVILEQGLITQARLNTATELLNLVAAETLRPYEAVGVLKSVVHEGVSIYEGLAREQVKRHNKENEQQLRMGDLFSEAGLIAKDVCESTVRGAQGSVRIGKILLSAGLTDEPTLLKALRLQSLWRYGYLSRDVAIAALKRTTDDRDPLERTFLKMKLYVPPSMQWSWI